MRPAVVEQLLLSNSKVAQTYRAPPALMSMVPGMRSTGNGAIIISCSDPRMNPYQIFGIDPATIKGLTMIRNAGGRAVDAIRTISVLQTIGNPKTVIVLHHTDCGMTHFHDDKVREAMLKIAPQEAETIKASKYGEITGSIEESVKADVALLKASPFIQPGTTIVGVKYDINTGVVTEVESATIDE